MKILKFNFGKILQILHQVIYKKMPIFKKKNQLDNLVDFEKCCKTRIYYLLAKIGADTADIERTKNNWNIIWSPIESCVSRAPLMFYLC